MATSTKSQQLRAGMRPLLLLSVLLVLPGCITSQLWGYEWRETWNLRTKEYDGRLVAVRGTQWEWWRVMLRVVATPVTLVADGVCGVGWCVLEGLGGDEEDDDVHFGSHSHARDRERPCDPNSPKPPPPPVVAPSARKPGKPMLSGVRR